LQYRRPNIPLVCCALTDVLSHSRKYLEYS